MYEVRKVQGGVRRLSKLSRSDQSEVILADDLRDAANIILRY